MEKALHWVWFVGVCVVGTIGEITPAGLVAGVMLTLVVLWVLTGM